VARHIEGPWFRKSKNTWYITQDGRNVSLGVGGKGNRKEAVAAWHKAIADGPKDKTPAKLPETVSAAVAGFLADAQARTKPSTHALYKRHLDALTAELGKGPVAALTVPILAQWLQGLAVGSTTQAITLRSVSAFLGWCVRQEIIARNPAQAMAKPKSRSRGADSVISPADHAKLLEHATPQLRLVLSILHATGARPGEVCKFAVENFDPSAGVVKLAEHKADHTGRIRLVFLPPETVEVLKAQADRYGSGALLRNRLGKPWTPKAIAWALLKLREKAGVKAIAYGYRHTFATDGLANGLPETHVAELLGHGSTAMLHKHYSHLTAKAGILRNAAALVRPAVPTAEPNPGEMPARLPA
jgi:integrase/recombinase XerC